MNQAQRKSQQVEFEIEALRREVAYEDRLLQRMRARREEIIGRKVANEARRKRFLRRLDHEIEQAERLKAIAEANIEGLVNDGGNRV